MERSLRPTLDVVLASYIDNHQGKYHTAIGLPSQVPDAPDDIRAVIWDDCFDNFGMTLDYLMDLRQNDVSVIAEDPSHPSTDIRDVLLAGTIYGKSVETMDMHDIIAAITVLCTANVVMSDTTVAKLEARYPSKDERHEVRDKTTMGYMTDLLVFLLAMSDGIVSMRLGEFKELVRSLPVEIDAFTTRKKESYLHHDERMKLREVGYAILESLEERHYVHINAHMESMKDSIQPSQLQAIRLRDFKNGPTPPIADAGECFDGLFTLWFWYNSKMEYIYDAVSS